MFLLFFSCETFTMFSQCGTIKYTSANVGAWKPCDVCSQTTVKLKLEVNNRNTAGRPPNTRTGNDKSLSNIWVKGAISKDFQLNENKNIFLQAATKTILREKFIVLNTCIRKKKNHLKSAVQASVMGN